PGVYGAARGGRSPAPEPGEIPHRALPGPQYSGTSRAGRRPTPMFLYSIFGGSDGELPTRGFTVFTLFGGTAVRRPTLAQELQDARRRAATPPRRAGPRLLDRLRGGDRGMIVTIFGGCEIKAPTLADEYLELRGLIESGAMTPGEVRDWIDRIAARTDWVTISLFDATWFEQVPRRKQVEALEAHERSGLLPPAHRRKLEELVGVP